MGALTGSLREWADFATEPAGETGAFASGFGLVPRDGAVLRSSSDRLRVDTAEVGRISEVLTEAAGETAAVEARLLVLASEVGTIWAVVSERLRQASESMAQARREVQAFVVGVGEFAAKTRLAQLSYEHAEELAETLVKGFDAVHAVPYRVLYGSAFSVGIHPLGLLTGAAGFAVTEGTLLAVDSASRGTAAAVRSSLAGSGLPLETLRGDVSRIKAQRRSVGLGLVRLSGFRKVGEHSVPRTSAAGSATVIAEGLRGAGAHDEQFDAATGPQERVSLAHVDVTEVTRPDGTRTFVVAIPGTDFDNLLSRTDPNSAFSIADVATTTPDTPLAQSPALLQLVDRALAEAGAGREDPVLLSGFSQGGMAAMALASNREFMGRYSVRGVVTTGTPSTMYRAVPREVRLLHLRDVNDPIPVVTGGGPDPGNDHAVVVETNVGVGGLVEFTHDADDYVRAGRAADRVLATTSEGREHAELMRQMLPAGAALRTMTFESSAENYDRASSNTAESER
ncbi:hypothetical protein [Kocuria massiliensis]|uniref:hypothetical protein n=1 Tax=Kocuria massiliensis TaxID=1926282 RepID=UPI0022B94A3B|nr:hypothetical protein [Kocuria massiliensis]